MINTNILEDIAKQVSDLLPSSVSNMQDDIHNKCRSILQSSFAKLDLVTREEFDVQSQVLARTRSKVDALEKQLAALEKQVTAK